MIQYYSVTRKHTKYKSGQNHRKATATVETISKQLEHVTKGHIATQTLLFYT